MHGVHSCHCCTGLSPWCCAVRVYEDEVDVDGLRVQSSTEPPVSSFLGMPATQHGNGA